MSCIPGFIRFLVLSLLLTDAGMAQKAGWDSRLAETFSGRWKEIQKELAELAPKLEQLPGIPIDDQGGTGGYADNFSSAIPTGNTRFAVEVRWPANATVDLVALVPARRYDAKGLDAQYGLPEAFTVELIDSKGEVIRRVAKERNTRENPARKGHPFVYQVSPPTPAAGMRISADRLNPEYSDDSLFVHAWA